MDRSAFDRLARLVAARGTRRSVFPIIAAAAGIAAVAPAEAGCARPGASCKKKRCCSGTTCTRKRCACTNGLQACGGQCVNTQTDTANCGSCATNCNGADCTEGTCTCTGDLTFCGSCVDLQTDVNHCASCDTSCAQSGAVCTSGACTCVSSDFTTDPNNNDRCFCNGPSAGDCAIPLAVSGSYLFYLIYNSFFQVELSGPLASCTLYTPNGLTFIGQEGSTWKYKITNATGYNIGSDCGFNVYVSGII